MERKPQHRGSDDSRAGVGGGLLPVMALVACCGVPLLFVLGAGALASIGAVAARYWPLTLLGLAVAAFAGVKLGRLVRARSRALRGGGVQEP